MDADTTIKNGSYLILNAESTQALMWNRDRRLLVCNAWGETKPAPENAIWSIEKTTDNSYQLKNDEGNIYVSNHTQGGLGCIMSSDYPSPISIRQNGKDKRNFNICIFATSGGEGFLGVEKPNTNSDVTFRQGPEQGENQWQFVNSKEYEQERRNMLDRLTAEFPLDLVPEQEVAVDSAPQPSYRSSA